ncbi:MAG: LptF/LptG family permease [Tepidisphaeraceae bacterium]
MKTLDRYVLFMFLKNYLISFMVLVGLFIVLDMVFNFDELIEVQTRGGGGASFLRVLAVIGDYYFYQLFVIFAQLSGIIPVAAAAFTLVRFARFNELTAMLAAGIPLLRVSMPIILASLALNVLLLADQEAVIPRLIPQLTRSHDQAGEEARRSFDIKAMQDDRNGILFASRYTPASGAEQARIFEFDLIQRDPDLQPVAHISADRAVWDPGAKLWQLTRGRIVTGLRPSERRAPEKPIATYQSNITPEEISLFHSGNFIEMLSTSRINQLLQRPQSYGTIDLLRVKHARVTQWIMNLMVVLLAIGCVLTREPGTLKTGIIKLLVVVGLAMAGVFLCHQLASHPPSGAQWADRWPAIMAWIPIFVFGPIAIWLLDRVQTSKS